MTPAKNDPGADLDGLMARVHKAAALGAASLDESPAEAEPIAEGVQLLLQVISAQSAWNDRTTKSLATITECLRNLQDAVEELRSAREKAPGRSHKAAMKAATVAATHTAHDVAAPTRSRQRKPARTGRRSK